MMFGIFKKKGSVHAVSKLDAQSKSDDGMRDAVKDYFVRVIERADAIFAEEWRFDPNWIGTLSVASELDAVSGTNDHLNAIHEYVLDEFMKSTPVEKCATMVMLKHMANQRKLEDVMRQSGGGKLWLPPEDK